MMTDWQPIALPASNATVLAQAINPALGLLPERMATWRAKVMLLAIGRQESGFAATVQGGGGPARGLWQFELGATDRSGVRGVFNHAASHAPLASLCEALNVDFGPLAIYDALPTHPVLAAGVARLLLWTDAQPLPVIGDAEAAWACYAARTWRPGKPHAIAWPGNYRLACEVIP